jgi:2-hydroxychromene-2-carboxylate isomerase
MSLEAPVFYYDVGSPWSWLAGERLHAVLDTVPTWQPVLETARPDVDREAVARAALAQGLPAPRWPEPFPFDSERVMLAATYAKQIGRAVAFSLAAMRQAFAAGRDLSAEDNLLIAAAACEMHPKAVLTAIQTRGVRDALASATAEAQAAGVVRLPALRVGDRVVHGPDAPEAALPLLAA